MFARHAVPCAVSIACWVAFVAFVLVPYWSAFGLAKVTAHYAAPLFVFGSWLVVTTFLHHNEENVPWYADEKWDFVRGNLSSLDRHYGWAHDLGRDSMHFKNVTKNITKSVMKNLSKSYIKKFKKSVFDS